MLCHLITRSHEVTGVVAIWIERWILCITIELARPRDYSLSSSPCTCFLWPEGLYKWSQHLCLTSFRGISVTSICVSVLLYETYQSFCCLVAFRVCTFNIIPCVCTSCVLFFWWIFFFNFALVNKDVLKIPYTLFWAHKHACVNSK